MPLFSLVLFPRLRPAPVFFRFFFAFPSPLIEIWNIRLLYCRKVRRNPAEAPGSVARNGRPGRGEGSGGTTHI